MLTIEELLKVRYKQIADYPEALFHEGDIIKVSELVANHRYLKDSVKHIYDEKFLDQYPHLFKKLQWWQERKIEDLPEYIMIENEGSKLVSYLPEKPVWKVNWKAAFFDDVKPVSDEYTDLYICWYFWKSQFKPATAEEYELQNKKIA